MNDYEGMSDDQIRLLHLEAKLLLLESEMTAFLDSFYEAVGKGQISAVEIHNKRKSKRLLRELLRGIADMDNDRASKIARILKIKP